MLILGLTFLFLSGDQCLEDEGPRGLRLAPEARVVDRHFAPGQKLETFPPHRFLDNILPLFLRLAAVFREKDHGDAQVFPIRERDLQFPEVTLEDLVRDLRHYARAVTRHRIRIDRPAVSKILQARNGSVQDLVTRYPMHVCDEAHAASIVLLRRIVEALLHGISMRGRRLGKRLLRHRNTRL